MATFQAGDLIREYEPWIWTVEWNSQNVVCASCCRNSTDLKTCQGCQVNRYCNKDCQILDWKNGHKYECSMLNRISHYRRAIGKTPGSDPCDSFFSMEILLLLKIMNSIKRKADYIFSDDNEKTSAKDILKRFPSDPRAPGMFRVALPAKVFRDLLEAAFPPTVTPVNPAISESDILAIYGKIRMHSYWLIDFTEDQPRPFGCALYPDIPKGSLPTVCSDHNVLVVSRGKRLRMVAIEDIPRYSGLQDARCCELLRFPLIWPLKQRRERFKEEFGRLCDCRKCTTEYDAEINPLKCITLGCSERIPSDERALQPCEHCGAINESNLDKFRNVLVKCEKLFATWAAMPPRACDSDDTMLTRRQLLEELDATNILQPEAHLRFAVGWNLCRWYEKATRFEEGWKMYHQLTSCVRVIFPGYHLFRAQFLHWAGMGPFNWFQSVALSMFGNCKGSSDVLPSAKSALVAGMNYLQESVDIYAKLYGKECRVVRLLTDIMNTQRMLITRAQI